MKCPKSHSITVKGERHFFKEVVDEEDFPEAPQRISPNGYSSLPSRYAALPLCEGISR